MHRTARPVRIAAFVLLVVLLCAAATGVGSARVQSGGEAARAPVRANMFGHGRGAAAAHVSSRRAARGHARAAVTGRPIEVAAWPVPWDVDRGLDAVARADGAFVEVSPFWWGFRADGSITAGAGTNDADVRLQAAVTGLRLIPTISNSFDRARVHHMLATRARRAAHVRAITRIVTRNGYDGIDIDYENVAVSDRRLFTRFVRSLAASLHREDRLLSVTVMAKTRDNVGASTAGSANYAAIGQAADRVRIMEYDQHWSGGSPGAIGGCDWVEQVTAYAARVIPVNKLQMGLPLYGYDWGAAGTSADALTWGEARAIAKARGARVQWSARTCTHHFTYRRGGVRHQVWFEDHHSIAAKVAIARRYRLSGVVFWRLGGEDPAVWNIF